ncbi:Uncharacterized protein M6B38_240145 [Iris pallida]|uniref:Uncharacterized protein n=1 Tax=Iris pallida TaxID=29817 RepID=A0AAX6DKN8_IRIPA|nr:Uncharacterized protein M6B38_240145 [Iris pallida]
MAARRGSTMRPTAFSRVEARRRGQCSALEGEGNTTVVAPDYRCVRCRSSEGGSPWPAHTVAEVQVSRPLGGGQGAVMAMKVAHEQSAAPRRQGGGSVGLRLVEANAILSFFFSTTTPAAAGRGFNGVPNALSLHEDLHLDRSSEVIARRQHRIVQGYAPFLCCWRRRVLDD